MEYTVVLTVDKETGFFVVEVPCLPGCISQGKTKSEALENIQDAIKGYLESIKKHPEEQIFEKVVEIKAVTV